MKIEIEVKPGTTRRIAMIGATFLVLGVAAAVYANQVHFTNGQTLTATDLNTNFDELYARTVATGNGKSISINGTYCGVTAATYDGAQVGGYTGAKTKCEATCGAATAHMCSTEEMNRSAQLGLTLGARAWYSTAIVVTYGNTAFDCNSWTSATAWGFVWNPGFGMNVQTCASAGSSAIACCN